MNNPLSIDLLGQRLWLLADKALYWPARRLMLVADVHIGKAATFRAQHLPVPRGTTQSTLQRLDRLLAACPCERLIILGDFLHARAGRAPATLERVRAWREAHAQMSVTLVRGNHDQHAGDPPACLRIEVLDGPLLIGPFALQHAPDAHPTHAVIAGHVHPVFVLRGRARQRLRLPCFVMGERVSVLPAFGDFTGGWVIEPGADEQVYLAADGQVWPVAR